MRLLLCCALAFVALTSNAFAQNGRWLRADSPGFVVYSTASEERVRSVVSDLEAFDALLRRLTQTTEPRSPAKLEIYLFSGPGQFSEAWPGYGRTARGLYAARTDIIAAYAVYRDTNGLEAQDILFHEYAHHFMYQHFANVYPAWYVEGFAEFVATTAFEDGRIVLGRVSDARVGWLDDSWLPMERMIEGRPDEPEDVARFYAQSWLFTHYLFSTPGGMDRFRAYVRELRMGMTPSVAFRRGFGMRPAEMQTRLREYLRGDPPALALTRPAAVQSQGVTMSRMPASADEVLPIMTRVRRGWFEGDEGQDVLHRVRQLIGTPHDSFGTVRLAETEATLGDVAIARGLLEPYLVAHPEDPDAQYVMGFTYLREAREANERQDAEARDALYLQARRYFSRAHRIDGNHVPTLFRYVETYNYAQLDDATSENVLNILLLAHQLAPQVPDVTFRAADWLLAAGRPAEAVPMLRTIAYNPHGGEAAQRALERLVAAEAALAQATPAP
jgi:hypothetical protein